MSLLDHLNEMRWRLVRCLIAAAVGFCVCWAFVEPIFAVLVKPLLAVLPDGGNAMYSTMPEAFFIRMFVACIAGVFLASPVIFYQIWAFISPGLYEEEKLFIVPVAIISAVFFVGGALFCYNIVFPFAFQFFMSYNTEQIRVMPRISDYVDFVLKLLIAFGLIFEMPLFAFFLSRMGVLTAGMMRRARRYAILGIFIVAAILTPPDVLSQLLMAVPMLVLYEISVIVAAVFGKKKKTAEPADGGEDENEPQDGERSTGEQA
ncbi:MAG TPA: twin-arginine translocase subunit TatC [Candidatus Desulfovibrio gallistercoris]|nr:twin-arginine translocase subunit TatC [Candidatus Desulfovibrio gallistercoris]